MSVIYSQVPGDRGESTTFRKRSQDPGGICCPESQVRRDFWRVHSLQSRTWNLMLVGQGQPGMNSSVLTVPLPSSPQTLCKRNGGEGVGGVGKRPLCNLQACHLGASFCSTSSKGFSWHQVQGDGAHCSPHQADQEGCIRRPHLRYRYNWGWTTDSSRLHLLPCWGTCLCCGGPPMFPWCSGRSKLLSEPGQTQATSPASLPLYAS